MVIVVCEVDEAGEKYMRFLRDNLLNPHGFMFMMKGSLVNKKGTWILHIEPNIPEFWQLGIVSLIAGIILKPALGAWSYLAIVPGIIMLTTIIFWSSYLYKLMLILGMKKRGGKVTRFLKIEEVVKRVL